MVNNEKLTEFLYYRGRVALCALLRSLNIGTGDQVALQAFTCVANPEAIMATGATPVYIDIEENGVNMAADDLEKKISPEIKAIIIQHTFGIPADMDSLLKIALKHNIHVIEDCCHTLETKYKDLPIGSYGIGSFYSFEWGKPIVAGIGGALVVNDDELSKIVLENYLEYSYPSWKKNFKIQLQYFVYSILYRPLLFWPLKKLFHALSSIGIAESNYNPIENCNVSGDFSLKMSSHIQSRLEKRLRILGEITKHSSELSQYYYENLSNSKCSIPAVPEKCDTVFARFPVIVKSKQDVIVKAKKANIELADWYNTPVHPLEGDELKKVNYIPGTCPNVEKRCGEIISLPLHKKVSKKYYKKVIKFLNNV